MLFPALIMKYNQIFVKAKGLLGALNSTAIPTAVSTLSARIFPVRLTCNCLEPIDITLYLSNDPAACSITSRCPVIGVYAATDINFVNNTILAPTPSHTWNNLYPFDALGVGYNDPINGYSFIYYDSGGLTVINNDLIGNSCYAGPYNQLGSCHVVGCALHCDNGLIYDLSAVSNGSASEAAPQTVYPAAQVLR